MGGLLLWIVLCWPIALMPVCAYRSLFGREVEKRRGWAVKNLAIGFGYTAGSLMVAAVVYISWGISDFAAKGATSSALPKHDTLDAIGTRLLAGAKISFIFTLVAIVLFIHAWITTRRRRRDVRLQSGPLS
jgi:hypothetical protein